MLEIQPYAGGTDTVTLTQQKGWPGGCTTGRAGSLHNSAGQQSAHQGRPVGCTLGWADGLHINVGHPLLQSHSAAHWPTLFCSPPFSAVRWHALYCAAWRPAENTWGCFPIGDTAPPACTALQPSV